MLEENIKDRRSFKIVSAQPGIPGVFSLTALYDYIRNGSITVQWL